MPPTLMVQFCSAARIVCAGFGCGCVVLGVVTADTPPCDLWLWLVLVMVILVVVVVVAIVAVVVVPFFLLVCAGVFLHPGTRKKNRFGAIRGRKD